MVEEVDVALRGIDVRVFTTNDDTVLVDKVAFETPDAPEGQITFKPRKTEVTKHKIAGVETTETNTVRYTPSEFAEEFETIGHAQDVLQAGGRVNLTATVSKYDQSKDPDADGDKVYAYVADSHLDTINLDIKEEG